MAVDVADNVKGYADFNQRFKCSIYIRLLTAHIITRLHLQLKGYRKEIVRLLS